MLRRLSGSLISRLDNASAIPLTREHAPVFGRSGDVQRKFLTWDDAYSLLADEIQTREAAASTYTALHQHEEAQRLLRELRVITRYRVDARPQSSEEGM
jgi:hypothetical protein